MKVQKILIILCLTGFIVILSGCSEWAEKQAIKNYAWVEYNGNGATAGIVPIERKYIDPGEAVYIKENSGNFEKVGYSFSTWNTASNGSGKTYNPKTFFLMGDENITLYAQWE